jgi:large subunit ribosomal protein L15
MKLNELRPAKGSMKKRFKKGRGPSSGLGKTAGRGGKGQTARKSGGIPANFEGGQTPFQRRVPKRGFNSHFAEVEIVNLGALDKRFTGTVSPEDMVHAGLISNKNLEVKVLAKGKLTKALTIKANRFSEAAKAAIEAAGGKAEVI